MSLLAAPGAVGAAVSMDTVMSVAVSTSGFMSASIGLDSRNNVHMVFVDTTTQILKYAKLSNGTTSWVVSDVTDKKVAPQSDMALSPSGAPHVVYYQTDTPAGVKHARLSGTTWVAGSVEDFVSTNTFVSIAVGSDDVPRLLYTQTVSSSTWYGKDVGGVWVSSMVIPVAGGPLTLALDDTNTPYILTVVDYLGDRYVIFAQQTVLGDFAGGTVFFTSDSLSKAQKIGLAIDKQKKAHMSYFDENIGGLVYGSYDGISFSSSTLDASPGAGYFSDIVVNDLDKPMIVYSSTGVGFRSAVLGASWTLSTLEPGAFNGVGPSLAMNRYNHYLAGYLNGDANELKFITDAFRNMSISGTVLDFMGSSIPGVTLTLSGGIASSSLAVSGNGGGYSADHLFEGPYTLTPSKEGYSFQPVSRSFSPLQSSVPLQNFQGGAVNFSAVGNLFNPVDGAPVAFNYSILPGHVSLKVYSLRGTPVRTLVDQDESAGNHSVFWDGRDSDGHVVASGIYLVYFEADQTKSTTKVAVVK
ncbi:MAG: hypothetical protein IPN90_00585 [Elusimicrobia bacterium]|nr:hypothetical protein [Elusimicrobiota bacterium]